MLPYGSDCSPSLYATIDYKIVTVEEFDSLLLQFS